MILNTDLPGSENSKTKPDENLEQVAWKRKGWAKVFLANILSPTPLRQYIGDLLLCNKFNYHHMGACRDLICNNYRKKGHTTKSCRSLTLTTTQGIGIGRNHNCYKCGEVDHFKRLCPRLANQMGNAQGRTFVNGTSDAAYNLRLRIGKSFLITYE